MSIELSDSLIQTAQQQAISAGFSNLSDYITSLIRADQRRLAKSQLDDQLLAGLDSGEAKPMTDDDWQRVRQTVRERHSQRPGEAN